TVQSSPGTIQGGIVTAPLKLPPVIGSRAISTPPRATLTRAFGEVAPAGVVSYVWLSSATTQYCPLTVICPPGRTLFVPLTLSVGRSTVRFVVARCLACASSATRTYAPGTSEAGTDICRLKAALDNEVSTLITE